MADLDFTQFINELETVTDKMESEIEQGLNENAEDLLNASQNLAPLEQGFLRESGSVDPAKVVSNYIVARVGFSTEYALRMHEDFYTPSVEGTGRKYLSKPTQTNSDKYAENLLDKMKGVWEK
jgi:hypothetical protein